MDKGTALRLSYCTCVENQNTSSNSTANERLCLSPKSAFFSVDRLQSMQRAWVDPERSAKTVEAVRSGCMTSRAAAKTSDIFVGSLQERISGNASKLTGLAQALYVLLISDEIE